MQRYVPLSLFWFLYFGGLGIFFPYYSLYLRENAGLDGTRVGLVMATVPLVGLIAQPLWGQLADRTGRRSAVLTIVALGAAVGYLALAVARTFPAILAATAGMALFATAVIPVAVSVTLAALSGSGPHDFGRVRVWGTVGYLVFVVGFPWGLHRLQSSGALPREPGGPSEPGLELMFVVTAALSLAAALVGPVLPREGSVALRSTRGDWRHLFREPAFVRVLAFTLLAFFFLQGPMALFPIYVRAHGGDLDAVGRMWVVMLLVEIPLVAFSGAGLRRMGARGLLGVGVIVGGFRWAVCGLTGDLTVIYVVQVLHGVVVTGLLLGGPLYVEGVVPARQRSTAQALLATVGTGGGGILSNVASGWLLEHLGPSAPYLWGGVAALFLGAAVRWLLPTPGRVEPPAVDAPPGAQGVDAAGSGAQAARD